MLLLSIYELSSNENEIRLQIYGNKCSGSPATAEITLVTLSLNVLR